jgi:hypothetical protein
LPSAVKRGILRTGQGRQTLEPQTMTHSAVNYYRETLDNPDMPVDGRWFCRFNRHDLTDHARLPANHDHLVVLDVLDSHVAQNAQDTF